MNLSKKEKTMLLVLGIFLVGIIYYQFIFLKLVNAVDQKTVEKQEIETKYNNAKAIIEAIKSQESKVKILNAKITDQALPLYPTISEEHIILELDKLIKDSGLATAGMEFDLVELNPVDAFKKSDKDKGYLESTMQGTADEYNSKYGDTKAEDEEKENNSENKTDNETKSNETKNKQDPAIKDNKENKIIKMKGKIKFYGTYKSLVKFVKAVGEHDKKICLYGIGMEINDSQWLKGEIGIGIYSIPKINDEMSNYLQWTLNNTYGKSEPFQLNQSSGTGLKHEGASSDFMVSVKQQSSDLPTIIMGKTVDTLKNTYIYADSIDKQNAEIVFTQKDGKYYYKYKTNDGSMPVNYEGDGCEFTPFGKDVVINISSEQRTDSSDKSGLQLNIVNNTNKIVMVNVNGDDKSEPRVSIDGDNKKISVNQK